jgi:bacterioferritin-associated ferredoxin
MILNFIFSWVILLLRSIEVLAVIVCHCRRVSDRHIRQAVRQGACTLGDVARACQAGGNCGGCAPAIDAILRSERGPEAARSVTPSAEPAVAAS